MDLTFLVFSHGLNEEPEKAEIFEWSNIVWIAWVIRGLSCSWAWSDLVTSSSMHATRSTSFPLWGLLSPSFSRVLRRLVTFWVSHVFGLVSQFPGCFGFFGCWVSSVATFLRLLRCRFPVSLSWLHSVAWYFLGLLVSWFLGFSGSRVLGSVRLCHPPQLFWVKSHYGLDPDAQRWDGFCVMKLKISKMLFYV